MVLGIFYFQKYKGHGDGDEQNVMSCLDPDRPGQNTILCHSLAFFAISYDFLQNKKNGTSQSKRSQVTIKSTSASINSRSGNNQPLTFRIQPIVESFQE